MNKFFLPLAFHNGFPGKVGVATSDPRLIGELRKRGVRFREDQEVRGGRYLLLFCLDHVEAARALRVAGYMTPSEARVRASELVALGNRAYHNTWHDSSRAILEENKKKYGGDSPEHLAFSFGYC